MTCDDIRLAELLCARMCHDLAGPTGAVINGAELMDEDDPAMASEAAALMAGAAGQIAKRLRFFRAAFGWEGGAARDMGEAVRIAADFLAPLPGQPDRFKLAAEPGPALPADGLRLLLLLVLFGSEALPRGGTLAIRATADDIGVIAEGTGASLGDEHRLLMSQDLSQIPATPRTAPILLALGVARRASWQISVKAAPNRVELQTKR